MYNKKEQSHKLITEFTNKWISDQMNLRTDILIKELENAWERESEKVIYKLTYEKFKKFTNKKVSALIIMHEWTCDKLKISLYEL